MRLKQSQKGGGEVRRPVLKPIYKRSVNSKPFSRCFYLHFTYERKMSTVQSEEYYYFLVKAAMVGGELTFLKATPGFSCWFDKI